MKNIKPFEEDCFEFHTAVVESKRGKEYKNRIKELDDIISERFDVHEEHFESNSFEDIDSYDFNEDETNDLLELYSYKSKKIQELRTLLTTSENNRIFNKCQYCTINDVNSFDHLLPKTNFSEFIVNPRNLFPCCTECNSYKGSRNAEDESRFFLNLYLDELPQKRYLFVNIAEENSSYNIDFYLDNPDGIEDELYDVIVSHYQKLHLLDRFSRDSHLVVSELESTLKFIPRKLTTDEYVEMVINRNNELKTIYGYNYWKSVLEIGLASHDGFMDEIG